MRFSFQNISIRYKITILVMVACTITLASGFYIALRNDINLLRKDFEEITATKAKLIGEYAISGLISHDKEGCNKILHTGTDNLDYVSIELYDENGNLFTKLGRAEEKIPAHIRLLQDTAIYVENRHEIKLSHVIKHNDYLFGFIILHTSTAVLENEISKDIKVLFISALVIILIGGVLVFYAQRAISEPIFRLTSFLGYVAENSNTSKTIPVKRKDEIGSIYMAINKLLKTIQKNAEERDNFFRTIQKNNDKLGRTLDAFSDGHWEYDLEKDTWFFSAAWLNTFGYKRAGFDFSNNFWEKLIHPDDLEEYKEKLQLHLNDKQEYFEADFRILGKKGGYRWVNFKGHWVERNEGKITDMLGITLDIQVKKDQEELVLASNRRKVNETKLVALSSMVSGISHSLKNLLSPVYGYADFGLMTITDNDQLKNELKIIKSSARNANDIIDDMLAFAGVENHSNTRIDLIPIIKKIISDWTDNKKDIKIQFQNKLIHATILGDKRKISQAIGNVLKNSYDASSEGDTIHIEIQYLVVSEENKVFFEEMPFGEYVSIKIKDFGEGIDEQHMDRIFEPFYSTKEIGTGVGLGLAVTKGVINSHKGYILVTSEAYKGTLTHIFLPTI